MPQYDRYPLGKYSYRLGFDKKSEKLDKAKVPSIAINKKSQFLQCITVDILKKLEEAVLKPSASPLLTQSYQTTLLIGSLNLMTLSP
jgi:hypothetical protein